MNTRSTLNGDSGRLPMYPLRTLRIEPGSSQIIRTLSDRYFGLMTHWIRGRSEYCDPRACKAAWHSTPRFYKGYFSGDQWLPDHKKWMPVCFELTEHAELDLRHHYARGQVWQFERLPSVKSKPQPVTATLLEQLDANTLGAALDLIPCLLHMYHIAEIDLTAKNPLPDRTMVSMVDGPVPKCLQPTARKPDLAAADLQEEVKKYKERSGIGTLANGKLLKGVND